jgi:nicotinamidase-related amidase
MEGLFGPTGHLMTKEEALLVFIDIQEKLMPAIADADLVIQNALKLAAFAKIMGVPKVVTEQEKLGATMASVAKELCDYRAVPKVHFNCFFTEAFRQAVEGTRKKSLVLCGVEAHICIAQTAIAALPSYKVHVVADAVSSRVLTNKAVALERMRQAGAVITSTEMVIYELLQRAGTDEFKDVLKLVK